MKNVLNRGLLEIFKVKRALKAYSVESLYRDREPLSKEGGLALIVYTTYQLRPLTGYSPSIVHFRAIELVRDTVESTRPV